MSQIISFWSRLNVLMLQCYNQFTQIEHFPTKVIQKKSGVEALQISLQMQRLMLCHLPKVLRQLLAIDI